MNPFFTPPSSSGNATAREPRDPESGDTILHDGLAPRAHADPAGDDRYASAPDVHVLSARSIREPGHAHAHAHHEAGDDDHSIPGPGAILDGKYRIEGIIGQGGMAVVLAAMHLHLDERVAIKLMLPQWAEDPELVERFMHEGRAATKIRSEHVVRVHDVGLVFERPYLVMECLEGSDLDQLIAKQGKLPVETAIDYLLQACEAIAEAHVHGIIHRDLKPANLFLTHRADGSACVKVLDFGISKRMTGRGRPGARETLPSMVMGSPHYMSPEQMQSSHAVDERSDLWALGAILHELVAGTPPFQGDTITALCATILRDPPTPLTQLRADVPAAVEAVVLRCLEKDPSRRFANVAELAAALSDLGSDAAQASAVRIARVLEGPVDARHAPMMLASAGNSRAMMAMTPRRLTPPSRRLTPNAVQLVDSEPRIPTRGGARAIGYVVSAMALIAVGSGIGWMIVTRDRALQAAERAADEPAAAVAPATQPAIPPPPVDGPAGTTTLTNASTPKITAATAMSAPDASVANVNANVATTSIDALPKSPIASAPQTHVHHTHLATRSVRVDSPSFPAPATRYVPSVKADDPSFASAPAATAPASPAPSADGDGLFEDRK